jgi:DNA polymerase-3 subunit delta'
LLALEQSRTGLPIFPDWLDLFLEQASRGGDGAALADALQAGDPVDWVDDFQRLWLDLSLAAHDLPPRYHPGQTARIAAIAGALDPAALARAADWLREQRRLARHALNPKLLADHAARTLLQAVRPAKT